MGFGIRTGMRLQDPDKPKDMTELHFDGGYSNVVEARFNGDVTKEFAWTANFNANLMGSNLAHTPDLGLMDLIAQYNPAKEFHIWGGRLLVPSDRSNFTGPFFMSPWNYPGFYLNGAGPLGPRDGQNGRDQGVTFWGNAVEDKLKYYVGAYGLDQGGPNTTAQSPTANAYYSARVSYSLQGAEPGYFGSSTYYGAANVVTIGLGGQFQKDGASPTSDFGLFMADILAEEATGAGTFTFEGQFYKYSNDVSFYGLTDATGAPVFTPKEAFYVLLSYLTPGAVGMGKIQPLVRLQQTADPGWTIFDGALAYVIKDYGARLVTTYEHIDTKGLQPTANSIQFGFQLQK